MTGSSKSWIATLMILTAPDAIAPMATFRPPAASSSAGFLSLFKMLFPLPVSYLTACRAGAHILPNWSQPTRRAAPSDFPVKTN
jgi:hypothetical protein